MDDASRPDDRFDRIEQIYNEALEWSEGERSACHSNRSGAWEIWVCDRDGSNAVQLTSLRGDDWDGSAWSPDGRTVLYSANDPRIGQDLMLVENFR